MNNYSYIGDQPSQPDGAQALDDERAGRLANLFSALSDPSRLRILSVLLQGEAHVQQICEQVGLSHSAVSHQLRGLRQMRIVRARKQGRLVFYSLDDEHVTTLYKIGLNHILHG